jgi:hypothetical protein
MSKTPLLLALLSLLVLSPAAFSGPPEGPSGRMVQDAVPVLLAEVKRLEKEVARNTEKAEDLAVARARLAAAEGWMADARGAWRKLIAAREVRLARLEALFKRGLDCNPSEITLYRGQVAEARCGLAEVEGDRVALARELPKVITSWESRLAVLRTLAKVAAISPDDAEQGEKALLREIRQARQRLDAVKRR